MGPNDGIIGNSKLNNGKCSSKKEVQENIDEHESVHHSLSESFLVFMNEMGSACRENSSITLDNSSCALWRGMTKRKANRFNLATKSRKKKGNNCN